MAPKPTVTPSVIQTKRLRRSAHSSVLISDGDDDQRAAHGRRAGLGQMRARPVVAHHLADLVARQARDHRRARPAAPAQRRHHRQDRAQRQVREHVKRACDAPPAAWRSSTASATASTSRASAAGGQRLDHALEAVDARALDQQRTSAAQRRIERARELAGIAKHSAPAPKLSAASAASAPKAYSRSTPSARASSPISRWLPRRTRRARPCRRAPASAARAARAAPRGRRAPSSGWRCRNRRSARRRSACGAAAAGRCTARIAARPAAICASVAPALVAAAAAAERVEHVVAAGQRQRDRRTRPTGPCSGSASRNPAQPTSKRSASRAEVGLAAAARSCSTRAAVLARHNDA